MDIFVQECLVKKALNRDDDYFAGMTHRVLCAGRVNSKEILIHPK